MAELGQMASVESESRFDPVNDLPGDLAAICLSFLGVRSLLGFARHVSHSWRDAIEGGLPAVWREVNEISLKIKDAQLAEVVKNSHGEIWSLCAQIQPQGLQHLHALTRLRRLVLLGRPGVAITPSLLSQLPLLEYLSVDSAANVTFPLLQFLRTVCCNSCCVVRGLHNLPALTKVEIRRSCVETVQSWPANLRDVVIECHLKYNLQLVDRISALQQLVRLETDWCFAAVFSLPRLATLQHFTLDLQALFSSEVFVDSVSAMISLRKIKLTSVPASDQDLQCLVHLTNMQHVTLCFLDCITSQSLELLSTLPNLNSLSIKHCNAVLDYTPVGLCTQLRKLVIWAFSHVLSLMEVQAISQLEHIEKLDLHITVDDVDILSHLCAMTRMRWFAIKAFNCNDFPIPTTAFAFLLSMPLLERVAIEAQGVHCNSLVGYLVQLPKLRYIHAGNGGCNLSDDRDSLLRLRDALPRLEHLF